jgi:monothiol glutaredoxin
MSSQEVLNKIEQMVKSNDIVLFMKGSKDMPMCGFSAAVVKTLAKFGLNDYLDINILADEEIRQGVKDYANWPTIPQLYIKGEFVGGCDIVIDMFASGDLKKLLEEKGIIK